MKRILSLILVLVLSLTCLAACGAPETPETPADPTYYVAIATESVVLSSRGGAKLGNNFAVVIFDEAGKIVAAKFDSTEINAPTLDETGAVVSQTIASKVESDYKKGQMAATWGEQADAFAAHIKGMTAAQVEALEITNELIAGCTMVSTSYSSALNLQALVVKAYASAKKASFTSATTDFKLGAGMQVSVSKGWSGVAVTADCAGAVLDANGNVITAVVDTIEQTYTVNADNTLTLPAIEESKLAKGDAYDTTIMPAGRWYSQISAFVNSIKGKTASEVSAIALEANGKFATDAELYASCSIKVSGFKASLEAAIARAN